jgi:Fe2+ or Zn2+ uptake regulation protein
VIDYLGVTLTFNAHGYPAGVPAAWARSLRISPRSDDDARVLSVLDGAWSPIRIGDLMQRAEGEGISARVVYSTITRLVDRKVIHKVRAGSAVERAPKDGGKRNG